MGGHQRGNCGSSVFFFYDCLLQFFFVCNVGSQSRDNPVIQVIQYKRDVPFLFNFKANIRVFTVI